MFVHFCQSWSQARLSGCHLTIVINDIACLDRTERLTSTTGMIRRLIERFPNFVPSGKDEQIEEFALYQTTKDLPPDIPTNICVDVFWGKMGKLESTSGKRF